MTNEIIIFTDACIVTSGLANELVARRRYFSSSNNSVDCCDEREGSGDSDVKVFPSSEGCLFESRRTVVSGPSTTSSSVGKLAKAGVTVKSFSSLIELTTIMGAPVGSFDGTSVR